MAISLHSVPDVATIRVLLVEDDERDAEMVRKILASSATPDFDVDHVQTMAAARELLDDEPFDLVLLDLGLPDTSGLGGLLMVQDLVNEMPFVLLTGRSDENIALAALQHGAEDYLVKGDADRAAILRSIRYSIERHRGVRELARLSTELRLANESLEQLTLLDPLTELLNRRGLQQAISREMENLDREQSDVIVLLIDIDDFKRVNDTFGLSVGDIVLKEIALRLRRCVRAGDYVGRIGGDEFLVILSRSDRAEVMRIAERTRTVVAATRVNHGEGSLKLTVSIAALLLTSDTPAVDEVLARAHQLLHQSKTSGKNQITYQSDEFENSDSRRTRHGDMCSNLSEGRNLRTVKQPIMRLSDQSRVGWEFFSRYTNGHTEKPDHFFRICAERNILTLVDHQCLKHAIRAAEGVSESPHFHVNLFPTTIISVPTHHLLEGFPAPMPNGRYCVEISEQQIIGDPSYLIEPVRTLREAGLKIAIDDVGFGNSCLESLIMLEPDVIKIDKRLIIGLTAGDQRIRQLERYLELGRTLNAEVIAEGIEKPSELDLVRNLGFEYGQGFLWGFPG